MFNSELVGAARRGEVRGGQAWWCGPGPSRAGKVSGGYVGYQLNIRYI